MGDSLKGKVAIVTGSGQGIGRGIALFFASEGAKIVTNNRKPIDKSRIENTDGLPEEEFRRMAALKGDAEGTAGEIRRMGGEAVAFYGDVSDPETAKKLVETAVHTFGRIDILVNNAACLGQGTIENTTEEEWDYMTQAKMKGAFHTMHSAIPYMKANRSGRILNCVSNAWRGIANLSAYSAGNSGVVGLTKAAAKELQPFGITVNAYCPQADSPGHILEFSKTIRSLDEDMRPGPEKMKQIERQHGDPYDLAPFLAYLCTEDAGYISGSVFGVTGAGRIEYFSEPEITSVISREDRPWKVEDLKKEVPENLLRNYVLLEERDSWTGAGGGENLSSSVIFPRGEEYKGVSNKAYLNMILGFDHPSKCSIGNVTFGPGAHNNWHRHFGYQVLMVTGGEGYYQEWGKPVRRIKTGDVVISEPGVKHWHGAVQDHWFVHIGMILNEERPTEGLEELTEEEYRNITD